MANLALAAMVALALSGCSGNKLVFGSCDKYVAVGSTGSAGIRLTESSSSCHSVGKGVGCGTSVSYKPATATGASFKPKGVFEVVGTEGSKVLYKALSPGSAILTVEGEGDGGSYSADIEIHARVPDKLTVATSCTGSRSFDGSGSRGFDGEIILPSGTEKNFGLQLWGDEERLVSQEYPKITVGALNLVSQDQTTGGFTCQTPEAPLVTTLSQEDYPELEQKVRIYDLGEVTGLALLHDGRSSTGIDSSFRLEVLVKVGDTIPCDERKGEWTKTLSIETPDVCGLKGRWNDFVIALGEIPVVYIDVKGTGICRLKAVLDGTDISTVVNLSVGLAAPVIPVDAGSDDRDGGVDSAAPQDDAGADLADTLSDVVAEGGTG